MEKFNEKKLQNKSKLIIKKRDRLTNKKGKNDDEGDEVQY